jgi:hypothetical protein
MSYQLKGNLQEDALGLWQHLGTRISPPEAVFLNHLYAFLSRQGWVQERETSRSEGASYNPRPARLARLLCEALEERALVTARGANLLGAALVLGCYGLPSPSEAYALASEADQSGRWQTLFAMAFQAQRAFAPTAPTEEQPSGPTEEQPSGDYSELHGRDLGGSELATLAAVRILDDVRHLHQRSLEQAAVKEILLKHSSAAQNLRSAGAHERTLQLIEASAERLLRRREYADT